MNYRHYREGRVYRGSLEIDVNHPGVVDVYVLNDDWQLHAAWKLAYQQYLNNTAHERAILKNRTAKWEDFRIYWGGSGADMYPVRFDTLLGFSPDTTGEFTLSTVVDTTDTVRTFTLGTPGATSYGILQEWERTYETQPIPSSGSGSPGQAVGYVSIQNEIDGQMADDLQTHGNNPPYAININSARMWTKVASLAGNRANGSQKLSTGNIDIPLGMVMLVLSGQEDDTSQTIRFSAAPGDYKGVKSWPIGTPQLQNDKSWKVV